MSRREFLKTAAIAGLTAAAAPAVAAAAAAPQGNTMPYIRLGNELVTRFIAGWNPIGGNAHAVPSLAKHMLEYFTPERTNEFLLNCENAGINAWQCSHGDRAKAACEHLRKRNSKLKILVLHAERRQDALIKDVIKDTDCIALIHHGNVTDSLFRAGKFEQVKDYLKKVHDAGILAGVSSHCPDHIKRVADEDWENDFFMTCFYYITRPVNEQQRTMGKVVLGEPFLVSDPDEMTDIVKQVSKPCLAFKILGAGRQCQSPISTEQAFKYAFDKIKQIDGVVVGMYPVFRDEIKENVAFTVKYGSGVKPTGGNQ